MTSRGPRFLDEDPAIPAEAPIEAPISELPSVNEPILPRGPVLLKPEANAPEQLDMAWMPQSIKIPRRKLGAASLIAAGLTTIVFALTALSLLAWLRTLLFQSLLLGGLGSLAIAVGLLLIAYGAVLEVQAYRALGIVEQLRLTLATPDTNVVVAIRESRAWLKKVRESIPDADRADRLLEGATTVGEVRSILHSQVAERLRQAARSLGRRAAVEGATLVAICPHPAWDGVIAGVRGIIVIRQVAALYGLRPGVAMTVGLARRAAWTAAGTAGLAMISQGLATEALNNMPILKHIGGALPETSVVAMRLYRLADVAAESCAPV